MSLNFKTASVFFCCWNSWIQAQTILTKARFIDLYNEHMMVKYRNTLTRKDPGFISTSGGKLTQQKNGRNMHIYVQKEGILRDSGTVARMGTTAWARVLSFSSGKNKLNGYGRARGESKYWTRREAMLYMSKVLIFFLTCFFFKVLS